MHAPAAVKPKKRPLLPPGFVRAMLAGHSALGLAFAALIYVVCLSGALSVFAYELQRWEQPDAPMVAVTPSADALAAALRNGYERAKAEGAAHDIYIAGPLRTPGRLQVHYDDHEKGIEGEWLANERGELVSRLATPWSEFIVNLHMHLHLPRTWGLYLVGLTGVALFSSLISGILSHPRILKDAFMLRWGGSRRLQEADIHNRLGVWGLPFHVVVSVTGALLGLSTIILGLLAVAAFDGDRSKAVAVLFGPSPTQNEAPAAVPDLSVMLAQVSERAPGAEFANAFVQHIGTAGQVTQVGVHVPGRLAFVATYHFDANGKMISSPAERQGGVGQWILGALQPLHFGWFAGLLSKLLYGVLGLALAIVTHTGVTIWLARWRDKGRAVPGWEKVWVVVGWSQPIAFATTALAAIELSGAPLLTIYLTTVASVGLIAFLAANARVTARALRLICALAFLAVAATHVMHWRASAIDITAWGVDLAIGIAALILAAPLLARRRAPQLAA